MNECINVRSIYSFKAELALKRMSGLTALERYAVYTLVDAQDAFGNYDLINEIYGLPLSGVNGLTGFKSKTATAINAPTHDINGYTFDGATQYLNSNYNTTTEGEAQNDFMFTIYVKNRNTGSNDMAASAQDGSGVRSHLQSQSTNIYNSGNNNSANSVLGATTNSDVLISVVRVGSSGYDIYIDGVLTYSLPSAASTGVPNADFYIAVREISASLANFFDGTISYFSLGKAVGFNHVANNTNVRAFLTTLGTI